MKYTFITRFVVWLAILSFFGCNGYLDLKPSRQLAVPDRLDDLQALLDNRRIINGNNPGEYEALTDNYYAGREDWLSLPNEHDRNLYIWHPETQALNAWRLPYQGPIYYANVVLDQLSRMEPEPSEQELYDTIRGSALFLRANSFFMLAQMFCEPYTVSGADSWGIPLRVTSAITVPVKRNTLQETYDRIIADLKLASELLPETVLLPTRPKKAAAHGLLARTYLSMGKFEEALYYADRSLASQDALIDFNNLVQGETPFPRFNDEVVFFNYVAVNFSLMYTPRLRVDTTLYDSYAENDLRKQFYFVPGTVGNDEVMRFNCFEGDYNNEMIFTGIMTSELYLIRAESLARSGDYERAISELNKLLAQRLDRHQFTPVAPKNAKDALAIIFAERRKELVNRGLRWMDLRRLNAEGAGITLVRKLGDEIYTLPPNDPRWTLLIPDEVIKHSGIPQNPR